MNRLIFSAIASMLASGCREPPPPPPPPNPLIGTRWVMGEGEDAPTIEFNQSRAGGSGGCNRWFAQPQSHHPQLRFVAIGSTRRACAQDVMDAEQAFLASLDATRSVRLDGDTLILLGGDGRELARLSRRGSPA